MRIEIQKASLFKRFSAWIFDLVMLLIISIIAALLIARICRFDEHVHTYETALNECQAKYSVDLNSVETQEQYMNLPAEERAAFDMAMDELYSNEQAMQAYSRSASLVLVMVSLGLLIGFVVIEFIFPLCFKNGMTPGKKIFQIAVMHTNGVKISVAGLFARCFLGKFAIETMVPVLILVMILLNIIGRTGIIVIGLLALLQIVLYASTKTRSFIHDILSSTVVVDYASQMIFQSHDELIRYKNEQHELETSRSAY